MLQESDPATLGSQGGRPAGPQFQRVPRAGAATGRQVPEVVQCWPMAQDQPQELPEWLSWGVVTKQLAQSAK